MNTCRFLLAASTLTFAFAPALAQTQAAPPHPTHAEASATPAAPQLQAALRQLWLGHVTHTREYAFAVKATDTAAANRAAQAVVHNAQQLADAIAGFYGKAAGEKMLTLLGGHWSAVKALTDAGGKNDKVATNRAMIALMDNAGEIAIFLSGANPYLPEDTVRGLLVAHGGHHQAQIHEVMKGDLAGEETTWAQMRAHMDVIADAMAGALVRQFPDKAH